MFYSGLRERLSDPERPQTLVNFSSGVLAAVAATVLTQPADVVRTRMQVRCCRPGCQAGVRLSVWASLRAPLRPVQNTPFPLLPLLCVCSTEAQKHRSTSPRTESPPSRPLPAQLGLSGVAASVSTLETLKAVMSSQGPAALLTGACGWWGGWAPRLRCEASRRCPGREGGSVLHL